MRVCEKCVEEAFASGGPEGKALLELARLRGAFQEHVPPEECECSCHKAAAADDAVEVS